MPVLHQIDPIAVSLGLLRIHWYGLMYLLGFAVAWWLGRRRVRAGRLPGVDENGFGDLMFYGMLGVVLGGRIGYILFYDFQAYLAHPLLGARYAPLWEVVAGTTVGMLLANVPVVLLGSRFAAKLPLKAARISAALVFLALGLWVAAFGIGN